MSLFNTMVTLGNSVKITDYTYSRDQNRPGIEFYIIADIEVPVGLFSDDLWYAMDNQFPDPLTGTKFTVYNFDNYDDSRWVKMSIELKGADMALAVGLIQQDMQEILTLVPTTP